MIGTYYSQVHFGKKEKKNFCNCEIRNPCMVGTVDPQSLKWVGEKWGGGGNKMLWKKKMEYFNFRIATRSWSRIQTSVFIGEGIHSISLKVDPTRRTQLHRCIYFFLLNLRVKGVWSFGLTQNVIVCPHVFLFQGIWSRNIIPFWCDNKWGADKTGDRFICPYLAVSGTSNTPRYQNFSVPYFVED